jgi:hypothetical protein
MKEPKNKSDLTFITIPKNYFGLMKKAVIIIRQTKISRNSLTLAKRNGYIS